MCESFLSELFNLSYLINDESFRYIRYANSELIEPNLFYYQELNYEYYVSIPLRNEFKFVTIMMSQNCSKCKACSACTKVLIEMQ